jgi:hypothetical protein
MSLTSLGVLDLQWRKARRSANNGACLELAPASGQIYIRDSKDQDGPIVSFSGYSWRLFVADVKLGQFDPSYL